VLDDAPDEGHVVRMTVAVSGDLGRSPRIQYHALALAGRGVGVDLIGTRGTECLDEIRDAPDIRVHLLPKAPFEDRDPARRVGFLLRSGWRQIQQGFHLFRALRRTVPGSARVLVQTPAAMPTLPLAWLAARLSGVRLVVDWHNLSASVLRDKVGGGPAPAILGWLEAFFGRRADAHLCVSDALAEVLRERIGIEARTLKDRPHPRFLAAPRPEGDAERRRTRSRLGFDPGDTPLLVCPTSWSADEDFGLLLAALDAWEAKPSAPVLDIAITGRGPGRADFERRVAARGFRRARVHTRWLPHADYALLLACADLGLCLHRSASGVDLPMKLSDMLGVGLPVCVFDYGPVLAEALPNPAAAVRFRGAPELVAAWLDLFVDAEGGGPVLSGLRAAAAPPPESWDAGWQRVAATALGLS
jgi:beta-1,4-mannosyltransferase